MASLRKQCSDFLTAVGAALEGGATKLTDDEFAPARELLDDISKSRASLGFSPRETATFRVSRSRSRSSSGLRQEADGDALTVATSCWQITEIIDQLGPLHDGGVSAQP